MSSYKISITKTTKPSPKPPVENLGFGQYFTDHMFCASYNLKEGWHNLKVTTLNDFHIHPGASSLHYGQELFEGLKAFKQSNGKTVVFRPEFNWQRMIDGSQRLCMQAPPKELMQAGLKELLKVEHDWIPNKPGSALYIRPTLIGTEAFLGVRPSNEYLFYILLSPVGSYYKEGQNPVKIWVEDKYVRAAPGGLGSTKAGANYAASLKAALEAKAQGYTQVLWLDTQHQYVEEVGTMNVFFVLGNEVVTPELSGSILEGGTRQCAITVLRDLGYKVSERKVSVSELAKAYKEGQLKEAFGTGTAAVISPIGELCFRNERWLINDNKTGPVAQMLYKEITDYQYGLKPDRYSWLVELEQM